MRSGTAIQGGGVTESDNPIEQIVLPHQGLQNAHCITGTRQYVRGEMYSFQPQVPGRTGHRGVGYASNPYRQVQGRETVYSGYRERELPATPGSVSLTASTEPPRPPRPPRHFATVSQPPSPPSACVPRVNIRSKSEDRPSPKSKPTMCNVNPALNSRLFLT